MQLDGRCCHDNSINAPGKTQDTLYLTKLKVTLYRRVQEKPEEVKAGQIELKFVLKVRGKKKYTWLVSKDYSTKTILSVIALQYSENALLSVFVVFIKT